MVNFIHVNQIFLRELMNWYAERNRKIKKAYAEGKTCAELAEKWDLGVGYIQTIIKKEEVELWKPKKKK